MHIPSQDRLSVTAKWEEKNNFPVEFRRETQKAQQLKEDDNTLVVTITSCTFEEEEPKDPAPIWTAYEEDLVHTLKDMFPEGVPFYENGEEFLVPHEQLSVTSL